MTARVLLLAGALAAAGCAGAERRVSGPSAPPVAVSEQIVSGVPPRLPPGHPCAGAPSGTALRSFGAAGPGVSLWSARCAGSVLTYWFTWQPGSDRLSALLLPGPGGRQIDAGNSGLAESRFDPAMAVLRGVWGGVQGTAMAWRWTQSGWIRL